MIKMRQHGNPASHADAERRQITVLFVDLVNSSHLAETLDPEDYSEIIVEYRQAAAAVIEAHGGFVARYLGDSISAYWGYPRARPQDPRRAIAAGRALIETITRSNRDDPTKTQIRIRIGVETGIVVVGQLGPSVAGAADIAGEAPVIAARLQALAEPNTVLITGNVRRLVERYFELSSWGTHELKGISAPVQAFKVIGERAVQDAGGFRSDRLYGREVEQDCLFSVWRDTLAGGGGTTLIAGEPGIGKTALVGHLRQIAVETGGVCLSSNCLEEGKHAPLRPVRDLLRQMTGVATLDDPAKTRRMLEAAAESDGLDRDAVQQLLLPLLEPPPSDVTLASLADRQQRMMACLIGWCQTIAARRPVLIVIEDIHWADGATLDFIASFASSSISTRLSLVVTSRTAFEIHWAEQSKLRLIVLERLNDDAIEALVERMAQDDSVDPLTRSAIVTRAEGNPLYAEELVLLAIRAQSEGRAADVLSLPSSLNESLLARLDDLGELRPIAQTAAVLGRDFDERILSDGLELSVADLAPKLSLLVADGILIKQSAPWASHSFKHSLIRDAAYGSLLKARRGALHAKYAEILVRNHPLLARMNPEIIAQHYEQAGLFGQAISWWKFAGEHASRQSSTGEAIRLLERSYGLFQKETKEDLSIQKAEVLNLLGVQYIAARGYASPSVERAFAEAAELLQNHENQSLGPLLFALWGLQTHSVVRANIPRTLQTGARILAHANMARDADFLLQGHRLQGLASLLAGAHADAARHFGEVLMRYDHLSHANHRFTYGGDPKALSLTLLAWSECVCGRIAESERHANEAIAWARSLEHPHTMVYAVGVDALRLVTAREFERATETALEAQALAEKLGYSYWIAWCAVISAALKCASDPGRGRALLVEAVDRYQRTGARQILPFACAVEAECWLKLDKPVEAKDAADRGLSLVEETGVRLYQAELLRLRASAGHHLIDESSDDDFEESFLISEAQGARLFYLRTLVTEASMTKGLSVREVDLTRLTKALHELNNEPGVADLRAARALRVGFDV